MVGPLSRVSVIAGGGASLSFYLAMPPWPGVEDLLEAAGPEHSFIVNKNLIEVIALLAIACMPTGQWFGMDRLFSRLVPGQTPESPTPATTSVSHNQGIRHAIDPGTNPDRL